MMAVMATPETLSELLGQTVQLLHEVRDVRPDGRVLISTLFTPPYLPSGLYPGEYPDGPWVRQAGGEWVIIGGRNEDGSHWQREGWDG